MHWNRFSGRSWRIVGVVGIFLMLTLTKGNHTSVVSVGTTDNGDTWRRVADMPTARCCFAATGVDGKIYAIGGRTGPLSIPSSTVNVVEEYNPLTDAWRTRAPMPTPRTELADAAAVVNGRIYVFGGYDGSDTTSVVEEYDPVTNTWRSRTPMPTARERVATAVVNGKIYVIGGKGGGTYVTTVEEYDPVTDSWRSRVPMPTARYDLAAAVVNGKIYAIGGWNGHYIAIVEEYDPATNSWQSRAPMPTGRGAAVVALNGKIYAIGGNDGTHRIATVEEYDPTTDMWVTRAPMPTPRACPAAVVGKRIYAIGGFDDSGTYHATVEEYTPPGPPEAPTVTVMSPNGGEYWQGTQPITWTATDPQDDPLTYTVYYSPNGGATWTQLTTGLTEPSYALDTTMVVDGVNYLIKVEASDGVHTGVDVSDAPFEIANAPPTPVNTAPTVQVIRPNGGERVRGTYEVRWEANDPDGDALTFTISYSPNGGQTWTQIASGVTGTSYQWDTSAVQVGANYLIKVEASDGTFTADDRSDAPFIIEREPETETEGVFIPSFGIIEAIGAIGVLVGLGWRRKKRGS